MNIEVGDHVLIAHREQDWSSWVDSMDSCVGKKGVVDRVTHSTDHGDYFTVIIPGERVWNYPESALELVGDFLPGHGPYNRHISQELPR